jgi:hypothetical protein
MFLSRAVKIFFVSMLFSFSNVAEAAPLSKAPPGIEIYNPDNYPNAVLIATVIKFFNLTGSKPPVTLPMEKQDSPLTTPTGTATNPVPLALSIAAAIAN